MGWRPLTRLGAIATVLGWRPLLLLTVGWRASLLGWRPSLLGWRPSLLGWRPSLFGWRVFSPTFSSLCSSGSPEATGAGSSRSVSWQTVSRGEGYCFHSRWFHSKHGHLWHFRSFFNCGIHNCSCIACLHSHTIGQLRRFNVHGPRTSRCDKPDSPGAQKGKVVNCIYIYIYHSKNFCRCLFGSCFPHGIYSSGSCSACLQLQTLKTPRPTFHNLIG